MTGSVWRKSPERMTTLPPKGSSLSRMSCRARWSASSSRLSSIVASSTSISLAIRISLASSVCAGIISLASSLRISGGLNLEWNVLPLRRRVAALPVVAVARATLPPDSRLRAQASSWLRRNVLPQPPLAWMKMHLGRPESTAACTSL